MGNTHTVRVVTSDYLEQTMVLSNGGFRVSPRELREEIMNTNKNSRVSLSSMYNKKGNSIMANVKPEMLEKLEKLRRGKF
jgi:predicted RNA-binding protein with PIN domain